MPENQFNKQIQELQILEHTLQNVLMQKQSFQLEFNETQNALDELSKTKGDVYKIIGGVMIKSNPADLTKELEEKKKVLQLRIQSIEKQESSLEEKANSIRKEVQEQINKKS